MPHPQGQTNAQPVTRREALQRGGMGFGAMALSGMMSDLGMLKEAAGASPSNGGLPASGPASSINPLAPKAPPMAAKAKRVVHLFMNGGPSHVDTFDPKPMLTKYHGKPVPSSKPTERRTGAAFKSPFAFKKYGKSGLEVSELFRHTAEFADDLCVVRSMHADVPNHEPSLMLLNCGHSRQIRPSMGSWVLYGLGTENQNLPGFMVMCPFGYPIQESQNWQAGFLPGIYQGTYIDTQHTDIEKLIANIRNRSVGRPAQRAQLDLLAELNREHLERRQNESALESRIQSFELAFRMQTEAREAFDVSLEPQAVRSRYGDSVQGRQLLIARRLLERGVRHLQLWHGEGQPWDSHDDIEKEHRKLAGECDRAIAAFLGDLKRTGLFEETLVLWGGEFGRTPTVELPTPGSNQGKMNGRDHNHYGYTMWMAGGGTKGGYVHGATDEFGFAAVEKRVHVHDLQATILHLLGFNHETFTYRFAGRDYRLTDLAGKVVPELIA